LPVFCETSAVYAHGGRNAVAQATRAWETHYERNQRRRGEQEREEYVRVLGGERSFAELLAQPPRDDESGDGWDETETSRFGLYARRWWRDLLLHETVTDG
jgi:hypothetical protein